MVELKGKVAVVTGAASGIGRALCLRLAEEELGGLVAADLDVDGCAGVLAETGFGDRALALRTDVSSGTQVAALVARAESLGPVGLYCSNAGIAVPGGVEVPDAAWQRIWEVNVLSHVYAARALLARARARADAEAGAGAAPVHLMVTASAAGLLTNLGSAPYSVTKHAAVALAEWLAITHRDQGLTVSCVCPQGVRTPLLEEGLSAGDAAARAVLLAGPLLDPADVADMAVRSLGEHRFLVLPHPEVAGYVLQRAQDPTRWLRGMHRLWASIEELDEEARRPADPPR